MDTIILQKGNELLQFIYEDGTTVVIYAWQAIVILCVCAAVAVALYVLMGLGLMKMAANNGVKLGWLGFVPFARYFIAGRVAGHTRLFGKKMKNAGFWLAIVSGVFFAFNAVSLYYQYYPLGYAFFGGDIVEFFYTQSGMAYSSPILEDFSYYPAVEVYLNVWAWVAFPVQIAQLFFFVLTFMQLFKKFNPRNYFTFTLLSFFGELLGISLAGAFVFSQRNRKAVNYNDYLKEQYMRMQGMYFPPRENPPDNPFREFGGRGDNDPGDPFAEYGEEKPPQELPQGGKENDTDNESGTDNKDDPTKKDDSPFDGF